MLIQFRKVKKSDNLRKLLNQNGKQFIKMTNLIKLTIDYHDFDSRYYPFDL